MDEGFHGEDEKEAEYMHEKEIWVSFCILNISLLWAIDFSG